MTNCIFLDIDGVLNHGHFGKDDNDKFGFADDCIASLKHVISNVSNVKIVITSAWQHFIEQGAVDKDTHDWRQTLCNKLSVSRDIIIGDCPDVNGSRAEGISAWIDANKAKVGLGSFVILDDECTALRKMFPNNVVDCEISSGIGLTMKKAEEAIWILSGFSREKNDIKHFVISDTHFCHANIIKYCNRPFADAAEMNAELIKRWNAVVRPQDIVWHLGDFCFGRKENVLEIFPKLNGKINLVLGNHDHHKISFYYNAGFHRVYDRPVIIQNFFILSHAPLEWVANDGPYANIYGHIHDSERYRTVTPRSCCACVERWGYAPILWEDIIAAMKRKEENGTEDNG